MILMDQTAIISRALGSLLLLIRKSAFTARYELDLNTIYFNLNL
jgi:membrane-anchored protein YejM (alkaline phosphatase superfamily)